MASHALERTEQPERRRRIGSMSVRAEERESVKGGVGEEGESGVALGVGCDPLCIKLLARNFESLVRSCCAKCADLVPAAETN